MRPGVYHEQLAVFGTPDGVNVAVDFFQDDDRLGSIYIRTQEAHVDLVRFFIEVPIIDDQDYRLDAVKFEFMSDVIQPLIMLAPSGRTIPMIFIPIAEYDTPISMAGGG